MAAMAQLGAASMQRLVKTSQKRRGAPKTRTGCLCCKRRRVKCDETRPHCLKCIKFAIDCDGYFLPSKDSDPQSLNAPQTATPTAGSFGRKVMRPGMIATNKPPSTPVGNVPPSQIMPTPSSALKFKDDIEALYFRTFQTETAAELAGVFDSPFWNSLLLQACHQEPFTKTMVTALAAMSTSRKTSHRSDSDLTCRPIIAQQTEFAYKQYQTALREIRVRLQKQGDSRYAIIACLLVCCFETLVGNIASANAHAISGQKVLEQWVAQHPYKKLHEVGITSPAGHLIEDDIIRASACFDFQIMGYFDPRPAHVHAKLRCEGDETIAQMPTKFRTITEARRYSLVGLKRILHSCREIGEVTRNGSLTSTSDYHLMLKEGISGLSLASEESDLSKSMPGDTDTLVAQQRQYSQEIERWRSAFVDLYKKTQLSDDKRKQSAAHTMLAYSIALDVALLLSLDIDSCSSDHLTSEFQDINLLTRKVVQYRQSHSANLEFTFDCAINPPLFICARFCRDRVIRREAISLLQMHGVSEGFWDKKYITALCLKVVAIEEEGVETVYIPGSARVSFMKETVHPEERWCTFHYIRGTEPTVRESDFRW